MHDQVDESREKPVEVYSMINKPAFPRRSGRYDTEHTYPPQDGMSLREYFAGLAMQGLLAKIGAEPGTEIVGVHSRGMPAEKSIACASVVYADALIDELNKGRE